MSAPAQDEALSAAIAMVGGTGAKTLEIGYLHDDVPSDQAAWWATATYRGVKLQVDNHNSPAAAVEALVEKLLTGARCQWCGGLVSLTREGAVAYPGSVMADGSHTPSSVDEIAAMGQCLWRRHCARWEPGCLHGASTGPGAPQDRAGRRRLAREFESTRRSRSA
jgi:hypothetical protein